MKLHRILTVLFIAAIVIHVFQVGVSLPRALHYEEAKPLPSAPVETAAPAELSAPVEPSVPETAPAESFSSFSGAVYNALQEAVDSGEMKITDIVPQSSHSAKKPRK